MKLGLDIHGVIDSNPLFFKLYIHILKKGATELGINLEIHILTGSRLGNGKVKKWLDENEIYYTHLFSIADYLNEHAVPELEKSTKENPFFRKQDWDIVKADYGRRHELDLILDDCDDYIPHFTTPFARYYGRKKL